MQLKILITLNFSKRFKLFILSFAATYRCCLILLCVTNGELSDILIISTADSIQTYHVHTVTIFRKMCKLDVQIL